MEHELKGLYVITDNRLIPAVGFVETVERAIEGGAGIVQLRAKGTPRDEVRRLGAELHEMTVKHSVPLIINDSPELALEIGAEGVHLGGNDPPIEHARAILGGDAIIGVSCYGDIERGVRAEKLGASYVVFGTPYNTPTKPGRVPTPLEVLREAVTLIASIPVFAIGGIFPENAREVLDTGVDGIAVITSVFGAGDPREAARRLTEQFQHED